MKTRFWKMYYRLKFGKDWKNVIDKAVKYCRMIDESTIAGCNHFYNYNGEQIRGWHKPTPKLLRNNEHPLVTKYKNK